MSIETTRQSIVQAMERLIAGNPLRSDGKLTIKSLAVEAAVPRHQLTEVHTDLKDAFYARVRSEDQPPAALVAEREDRAEAERLAEEYRTRSLAAEAQVEQLIRTLHLLQVAHARELRRSRSRSLEVVRD